MIKQIVGGVVVLVIGGSTVAVSQSDIVDNFSKDTGMTHAQAQQYVDNAQSKLDSFSKVGQGLVSDGNSVTSAVAGIDCVNYTYQWETATLDCSSGKSQLQTIGTDEVTLGNCYAALDTDLGAGAKAKMNECITDIDLVDTDYNLPIANALLDSNTIATTTNSNIYNKSVLEAAVKAN